MRHEITPKEAAAIHKARRDATCACSYCGRPVKPAGTSLDHYCDEMRTLDEMESRAGTR
jgi:hypothetical protein